MSDEQALLDAIRAAPDDDAPRLVYADLLTSRGDPRGEFIALQCRLAASPDDEARRKLRIAENALLARFGSEWAAPLEHLLRRASPLAPLVRCEFRRGFLEGATLPVEALEALEAIFDAAPFLRALRFDLTTFLFGPEQTYVPPSLDGRLRSARLAQVRELGLRLPGGGDAVAAELATCPDLSGVEALTLNLSLLGNDVFEDPTIPHLLTVAGVKALVRSSALSKVRQLDLSLNEIGTEGVRAVLERSWPLERLELGNNRLDDAAIALLASSPALGRLEHLGLSFSTLGATGLDALARSKTLTALRSLDLEGCELGGTVLARFLERLTLPSLTTLRLERTGLGDAGALALARAPVSRQLTSISLGHNRITRKGIEALAGSESLRGLERLLLNDPYQGKKDTLALLTASPTLANCRIWVKGRLLARPKPPKPTSKRKKKAPP